MRPAPATRSWCARPTTVTRSTASRRAAPTRSTRAVAAATAVHRAGAAAAVAARRDPRPRRAPARRAHRGVRPHHRRGGGQADQDRAGRGAARGVDVHVRRGRGAHARRRDGADGRDRRRRGQARRSRCACPIGVVGAISPFNFPLNLVAHKLAPAIAAGCPVVLKPASQTPLSAIALGRAAARRVRPPGRPPQRRHRRRRHRRQRDRRPPRHRAHHVHRLARGRLGHPGAARRARRSGLELGNNAPVIIEPDGDVDTAAAKIAVAGFSHAGQSCISTQRVYVHESIADRVPRPAGAARSRRSSSATRSTTPPTCRRSSRRGERERVESWIDEAVAAGAKVATGGNERNGVLAPTVLTNVHARHEGVQPGGVRPGRRGADLPRRRRRLPPRQRHPLRAAGRDLHPRPRRSPSGPRASSTSAACS